MKFRSMNVLALGTLLSLCGARTPRQVRSMDFIASVPEHVVTAGESLWTICNKVTGKPWIWPRIWSMNPHLTNPHWLHAGEVVRFVTRSELVALRAKRDSEAGEIRNATEAQAERARKGPKVEEVDTRRADRESRQSWRHVSNTTFVTDAEIEKSGTLTNASPDSVMLSQGDVVFLTFPKNQMPEAGSYFMLYRPLRRISHPVSHKKFGMISEATGVVLVESVEDDVAAARIVRSVREIERGQLVTPINSPRDMFVDVQSAPNESQVTGVVVAIDNDVVGAGNNHIVFIDKGERDGLKRGNMLTVQARRKNDFSDKAMPANAFDFATLVVVDPRATSSACLVVKASHEVSPGDRVSSK